MKKMTIITPIITTAVMGIFIRPDLIIPMFLGLLLVSVLFEKKDKEEEVEEELPPVRKFIPRQKTIKDEPITYSYSSSGKLPKEWKSIN
jgi:hypothetical protein